MARLDIKDAFYSLPLLDRLQAVSAFRWRSATFRFNSLPMGLFISPAILQGVVNHVLRVADTFAWAHVDDILIVGPSPLVVKSAVTRTIRELHRWGFFLSISKSCLRPVQKLTFCGIVIDLKGQTFALSIAIKNKLHSALQQDRPPDSKGAGLVAYALYTVGFTSAFRFCWWNPSAHFLLHTLLMGGPWPLPRPPERLWASDATPSSIAVVDGRAQVVVAKAITPVNIYIAELRAFLEATRRVPPHSAIGCDNTAVLGALRRSCFSTPMLFLASWLIIT